MDNNKPTFTVLQRELISLLCKKAGLKLTQRALAKQLSVSPTAVGNALPLLKKKGYIKVFKQPPSHYIELNRDEETTIQIKRIENLRAFYESKLLRLLQETHPGSTIIIFGSYSRGEDTIKSDIDLAIIGSKPKTLDLTPYEKKLERTININHYDTLDIETNLKANIIGGILLSGSITL